MPCETSMISVHPIAGKELGQQVIAQAMAKQAEAPKSDKSEKKKAKQEPMGSKGRHISRKSRNMPWVMRGSAMRPCCAPCARQSKCVRHVAVRGSVMFPPFTPALRFSLQNMSHILSLEVMQDLDAWYCDAIVLVDLVQPQGSSVDLLGWATDVPHRCRHGWKARRGEKVACYATDLEHTACCKMLIHFGHVMSIKDSPCLMRHH